MQESLYKQAAAYIRSRIISGEYAVGSQIPTENDLAAVLGISRPTLRQALDLLTHEGYLLRVRGRGTFVTEPKVIHESTSFITGYQAESEKHNHTLCTKVLDLRVLRAPAHVARELEIAPDSQVTRLTRLRHWEGYKKNAPVLYTIVYVPHKLFPDMNTIDFTNTSFYEVLSMQDLMVKHASRTLEVVHPPLDVAVALGISSFEPTVFITSRGKTESQILIEYSESYYPAGSSSFLIEINW